MMSMCSLDRKTAENETAVGIAGVLHSGRCSLAHGARVGDTHVRGELVGLVEKPKSSAHLRRGHEGLV